MPPYRCSPSTVITKRPWTRSPQRPQISKPMLYLYYGSKEELFGAVLNRELGRFVDAVRGDIDFTQSPKDLLRNAVVSYLSYIDANRASWIVLYTQATSSQTFSHTVREGREKIVDLVGTTAAVGHAKSAAGHRLRHDGHRAGRCGRGRGQLGEHRRRRRARRRGADDQPVLAWTEGRSRQTGTRAQRPPSARAWRPFR